MSSLVLLGKSGCGKSATGNSILGKTAFIVSSLSEVQDVSNPIRQLADVEGTKITVIDGLDVCYCGDKANFANAELALRLSGEGISAFLIVLKYGDRFGEEERRVIDMTKAIFGNDVIKTFGICVLAFGDNFQRAVEEKGENFTNVEEWFQQQCGSVQELFQECNRRCVLFNNRPKTEKERKEQVHSLIKLVKSVHRENYRKYTNENYERAWLSRSELLSQRGHECDKLSQEFKGRVDGDHKLQIAKHEPLELLKPPTDDFGTQSKFFNDHESQLNSKLQSQFTESESTSSKTSYNSAIFNVRESIMAKSGSGSQPIDHLLTSSADGTLDVCQILTPETRLNKTSDCAPHRSQKPSSTEKESVINDFTLVYPLDAACRVERNMDDTTSENDEMVKKMEKIEIELITLYNAILTHPNTKYDLKKAVKEKRDFLEPRAKVDREPKRQKLDDENDNIGTIDQIHLSNEVTLLLVGSAGNGKSATGNSILGKQVFKTTASTSSKSSDSTIECGTVKDVQVSVVDGPGVDTNKSPEDILKMSIQTLEKALKLCNYRFSGLLIVLKYGTRFTKQESDFIKTVKGILGKNVIRDYGVCIVTHGDNFEADNEDDNLSFKEWCKEQEGQIKDLLEECNFRCVLFNNRTKDNSLKELQVNQLLEVISKDKGYSEKEFSAAFKDMHKIIIETNAPKILEETKSFISKIKTRMAKIPKSKDMDKQFLSYEEVLGDVNAFEQALLDNYGDPENIKQSHLEIKVLRMEINNKMKNCLPLKKNTEIAIESLDKLPMSSNTYIDHPLHQGHDEETGFVIINKPTASKQAYTRSISGDSYTGRESKVRKPFNESATEERMLSKRNKPGFSKGIYGSYGQSQPYIISEIDQRIDCYKNKIENMRFDNLPRKQWKLLRGCFERDEKAWNSEISQCSITDRNRLGEQIFVIKGMFSQYMPKGEGYIWGFFHRFYDMLTNTEN